MDRATTCLSVKPTFLNFCIQKHIQNMEMQQTQGLLVTVSNDLVCVFVILMIWCGFNTPGLPPPDEMRVSSTTSLPAPRDEMCVLKLFSCCLFLFFL